MFRGSYVAVATPFDKDLKLDLQAIDKIVDFHINNNTDGLIVCGTTGEAATMNNEEQLTLIKRIKSRCKDKLKIIVGTGTNCTQKVIENNKKVESLDIDGVLVVAPYYNKPNQRGLYEHFKKIAANTKLPVVLYNVPGRTASNITAETTLKLAEIDNIVAIKEASGDINQITEILINRPEGFSVLSGDGALTYSLIALGGDGVISVLGNIFPKQISNMVNLALEGSFEKARELHYNLYPVFKNLFIEVNPTPVKEVMASMGLCKNYLRLPLVNMLFENKIKLLEAVKKVK